MSRLSLIIGLALALGAALAPTDVYAQRRGGGRGNEGGGGRGNDEGGGRGNAAPRVQLPPAAQPRVELPPAAQPRVRAPEVRTPNVRVPDVGVPNVRVPGVSGNVRGGAAGGVRVDGGNARIRTDGSVGGNVRLGEGRVRGDATLDGRVDGSVRRAGAVFPSTADRTVNQAIYRNDIRIGQRSLNIAPNSYQGSWQAYPWHRGYWNSYYGWNPQIGYGNGYYGNYGGYGIRLGNFVIGSGGYGGYGRFGGYGYGRYPIGWGYGGWGLGSSIYNSGYYPYSNPYWSGGGNYVVYDYAQPIRVTAKATSSEIAMRDFEDAREAFKANDFDTALALINRAVKENPSDGVLHEFRALTQFAMKDYNGAAATIHSVLAVGPGWDWATMASLYADVDNYTMQLRSLERHTKDHADEAAPKFLLGYHYMTTGHPQAAAREFANVVKLEPKDRVAKEMLDLVDKPSDGDREIVEAAPPRPAEETEPAPREEVRPREDVQPIKVDTIAGTWQSSRDDGSKFDLDLKPDNTFTWKFNQGSRSEEFSGTYTTEGSLLVLQKQDGGAMVGHVAQDGEGKFTFKLVGAPKDDPGLTFSR